MPICTRCGVQIESDYSTCPLCGAVLSSESAAAADTSAGRREAQEKFEPGSIQEIDNAELDENHAAIEAHDAKVRLLFHEAIGFLALAGAVVVLATDFAYGMDISWSRIPLISIGYVWVSIFLIPRLKRIPYLLVVAEILLLGAYLYGLNRFTGGPGWYWGIAFPIVASIGLLTLLSVLGIRIFKLSVLGGLAVGLVAAGLFTLCIDGILTLYFHDQLDFSWSIVTAASVVPLIAFLVSFERRLKKRGSNLQKHFHV